MGGYDDGHPELLIEAVDQMADIGDPLGVQAVGRLVQDQDLRIAQDGIGDPQSLLHTQGIFVKGLFLAGQPNDLQDPVDLLFHLPAGDPLDRGVVAEIFPGVQIGVEIGTDEKADPAPAGHQLLRCGGARDRDLPAVELRQAQQELEDGRFSRPVLSDQTVDIPSVDRQADPLEDLVAAVFFKDTFHSDHLLCHHFCLLNLPGSICG